MANRVLKLPSGVSYSYLLPWDRRQRLTGTARSPVAFDTETELIDTTKAYDVPRPSLATASSPFAACVVRPEQLADWVLAHAGQHLVGHNVVFDFWVVDEHLRQLAPRSQTAGEARAAWRRSMTEGRFHDTMLLDQLVRLASLGGKHMARRNLAEVAEEYARGQLGVDKADPFRLRYGELIGADWSSADPGFWDYAIKDAIATRILWPRLTRKADGLVSRLRGLNPKLVAPGAAVRYGVLTESLQVRGAAALFDVGRRGLRVDLPSASRFVTQLRNEVVFDVMQVQGWDPEVFLYQDECGKGGAGKKTLYGAPVLPGFEREVAVTRSTKAPRFKKKHLERALVNAAQSSGNKDGSYKVPLSQGKTGGVSLSAKDWKVVAAAHSGVKAWVGLVKKVKTLGYAEPLLHSPELHPRYNPLLTTGRAAASKPNTMQLPKTGDFREIFRARAGMKMLTVDYSYIELRTLAAICEMRYGKSVLGDVIRQGLDPHCYTAGLISGVPYEDIFEWVNLEEGNPRQKEPKYKLYKGYRQSSKAVNFGTGGGLGPPKLAAYAQEQYGVSMTEAEAKALKRKLTREIYPELDLYLRDSTLEDLAWSLGLTISEVASRLPGLGQGKPRFALRLVSDVVCGEHGDEEDYDPKDVARAWDWLGQLCAKSGHLPPWVRKQIRLRQVGDELWDRLFRGVAVTPTGRLRSGCSYTEKRNSPFQGLAADGAKLALWSLVSSGYRVVGFLHDEILVEAPEAKADEALAEVSRLMVEAMDSVLNGVPSAVSGKAADHWLK